MATTRRLLDDPTMVDSLIQEVGVNPAALPSANEQATAVRNLGPGMTLPNPFAGVSDFGTKQVPIENEQGVVGYETQPMTALEWLFQNVDAANPIYQALVGHTSTSITPYTDVNGNQFYHIAGKTGGPDRERYAQMYAVQGDQLVPVGEGQFYKGEHPDQAFKDFVGMVAGLLAAPVLGPYASAIGNALGITNAAVAQVVGQGIINTSIQVAQGVPIETAIKQNIASSLIPNVVGNPIIDNAVRAAAGAQLMGGNVENAVVNSLIASGAQSLAGDLSITGDRTIDSGLVSGGTSIAQALATGGDPGQSFIQGFTRGASTAISQDEAKAARAASGAGFVGESDFTLGGAGLDTSAGGGVSTVAGAGSQQVITGGVNRLGDLIVRLDNGETIDLGNTPLPSGQVSPLQISVSRVAGAGETQPLAVAQKVGQQRTVSAQQAADEMLTPIAQYFQIPNGSTFVRDLRNGTITEVVGEGKSTKVAGGALNMDFTTIGRAEGVPSNAQYAGVLYTTDLDAATDPYSDFRNIDVSTLSLTKDFDPSVGLPNNLERVVNADGSVVQIDKRYGDRSYFSSDGTLFDSYKTTYGRINDIANTLASIATSAPGEWSESVANGLKVLGIPTDKLSAAADRLNQYGTNIAPAQVNSLQQQWIRDVVGTVERNNFGREAQDGVNIAREILNITLDNPVGGFTLVGKELFQELPEAAVGGLAGLAGKVAGMTGVIVSQVLESAGGTYKESIQRIEDEIQKGFRAPMSRQDIESEAKANATKGGAITALLTALTPGGRTATGAIRNEMATEGLETYLTARASGVGHEDAIKESVVAGTIAGKVVGSTYAGDIAKQQVSNLTGQTGTPSASVTVTGRSGGRVAGLDDSGELAFVVTDAGNTLVIPSVNVTNNVPVVAGEFVSLSANNQIVASSPTKEGLSIVLPGTSGAGGQGNVNAPATTSPTIISSGPSALDMQNIMASSQYGQGAVNRPTTGAAQVTVGGTPAGVQPTTPAVSTMPIPGGGTQPVTSGSQADGARAAAEQARQAEIAARNFADLQSRTYKGQVYVTAEEAANARLADTAPKTPAATPAYSANVPATPEVVAELLALKGLPSSPGAIRILLAGNPTVAQVGQEIEVLSEMVRQRGVTQQPSTQPAGTPTVSTGQQGGPTVITQGGTETKPATQPTTTPATRPTTTPAVTPTTQPSVTETIDLTGTTGRVNIDTVSPVDTTGQDTTFLDTTPTGTRPVNTGPALDTGPAEETTPTYGEDDDIIRFLGLDRIAEQPVERAEPVAEPEDTTPGAVAGPADVATEEQLAIAPRPVYTPKPGTRVVDTGSSILPTRVQLSEGMGDDVEGTGEEEQQPVWNVRSLKLRRALGI